MTVVADDFSEVTRVPLFGIPLEKLPTYRKAQPVGTTPTVEEDKLNIPLLLEIMDFIKEHPTTWRQDNWYRIVDRKTGNNFYQIETKTVEEINSCGTSFCFAGHVALAQGFPAPPMYNGDEWTRKIDGEIWEESVQDFARLRLGLQYGQADALFDAGNSMIVLERMVKTLILIPAISGYALDEVRTELDDNDDEEFMSYLLEQAEKYNHKR